MIHSCNAQLIIWFYIHYGDNSQMQFILMTYFQWCVPQMQLFFYIAQICRKLPILLHSFLWKLLFYGFLAASYHLILYVMVWFSQYFPVTPWRPRFNHTLVSVGCVVGKVAMGWVSLSFPVLISLIRWLLLYSHLFNP